MESGVSDTVLFIGRLHIVILHLPIGFLVIACGLEFLSRLNSFRQYKPAVGFILLLGACFAVLAAALGYMLSRAGGYNEQLLAIHQWSGIGVAITAIITCVLERQSKSSDVLDKAYLMMMTLMIISLSVAGHYGGSLTHGSDYLLQYMPNELRKMAGFPVKEKKELKKIDNLSEAEVFTDIIYPILDARCVSCHNEGKRKGDLMMHTVDALMKGGENGPVLLPGNAEKSKMIEMIRLPEIDEHHMPPKGKSQLTDEQVELLAWWINEGAPVGKKLAELNIDEKMQAILDGLVDPNANKTEVEILLASDVKPADEQTLRALRVEGVLARPVGAEVNWLQASLKTSHTYPADSIVIAFTKISEQLTWLNLGETATTDEMLSSIGRLKNLTRLHLENTRITDEALKHLKELPYLEYLNLYGTNVTDDGIRQLGTLKNLRQLYVWQTKVTREGVADLQKILPDLEINIGMDSDSNREDTSRHSLKVNKKLQAKNERTYPR